MDGINKLTVAGIAFTTRNTCTVKDSAAGKRIAGWVGVNALAITRACCSGQGGRTQQGWCHAYTNGA